MSKTYYRSSSSSSSSTTSGGSSILTILFVVFLVLKLTNNIDWDWIWVLAPIWIPLSLVVAGFILFGVFSLIFKGLNLTMSLSKYFTYLFSLALFLLIVFVIIGSL